MPRKLVTATPALSLSAYQSGDNVGGKLTFTGALGADNKGMLRGVVIIDKAKQNAAVSLVLFSADPSGTTFTDNGALTVADADLLNVIGGLSVAAGNYTGFADNSFAALTNQNVPLEGASPTIYGALITTGSPTYAAADDLVVKLFIDA